MPIEPHQVRSQAKAFVDSLSKMSAKQREQEPTPQFANQFNRLLELARQAVPDVDPQLWPTAVSVTPSLGGGHLRVGARYTEIEVYARQVLSLLPAPDNIGFMVL
ncbi:hypothetical protein [Corallococcus exiguus]|uniref:hypothetical protein n=1 Tax=Corallococcus exiguus TaxID=83462 RepID=UPI0015613F70|nr:hypothetical protein [Corallococcus exiguus]NRD45956.1 hypothetical protein [Corallococcus exiguus]